MEENTKKTNKIVVIFIALVVLIIIAMIFSTIFALLNMNNSKIITGVSIEGIDVSDLTIEEATKKLKDTTQNILDSEINLKCGENDNIVKINEFKTVFDIEKSIIEAYNIGRNQNIIKDNYEILSTKLFNKTISLNYSINEEETDKKLEDIESKLDGVVVQNAYYIEGENLIITKGKEGLKISKKETKNNIKENIKQKLNNNENAQVELVTQTVMPDEINISKIHTEIYKEPKDAYYTQEPFKIYPEVNGIDFNISMEETEKLILEEKEEYKIPLKISKPTITTNQISASVFPNVISTFTTKYDASAKGRSTNITLVANAINGKVLLPGETFSFNALVGNTTKEKGYQLATSYINGKLAQDYGGGTCQVSTTLYNAVLKANLDVTSRRNHSYIVSYVDIGTDATIAYPTTDFQFKNNRNYAVKIIATAKNGILKVEILGVKEDVEYEVIIESEITQVIPFTTKTTQNNSLAEGIQNVVVKGVNGYKSKTYKTLRLNGSIISKTVISEDTYKPMTQEIEIGTKKN